jgi:hypothetical protein
LHPFRTLKVDIGRDRVPKIIEHKRCEGDDSHNAKKDFDFHDDEGSGDVDVIDDFVESAVELAITFDEASVVVCVEVCVEACVEVCVEPCVVAST